MKALQFRKAILVLACIVFTAVSGLASPILVSNFSFEAPVGPFANGCGLGCSYSTTAPTSWVLTGVGGSFAPGPPANTNFFNSVPDGTTIAYSNGGTLSQTVSATVVAGTTYTLLVEEGLQKGQSFASQSGLVIGANPIVLATGATPTSGNWSTFTATYVGVAGDVGKTITIRLSANPAVNNGLQGDWDNVRLDGTVGAAVPEPAAFLLFGAGLIGLVGFRRFRRA